jgi:4-carboxymuconolactone decarboxylase
MTAGVESRRAMGVRVMTDMFGEAFVAPIVARAESDGLGADLAASVLDDCFGAVWARPGLDQRARSIATIALLMALRQPEELKNHFRGGLANGLTARELEELVMHGVAYLGFPANAVSMRALAEVLAERAGPARAFNAGWPPERGESQ